MSQASLPNRADSILSRLTGSLKTQGTKIKRHSRLKQRESLP